ncbi:MAG TPA: nucleoside triphosphate pyrophosphohydrolase family protein [Kofleriaceae bacterium]|nr:nucleoside triphosphate pyrophosphohydrolase family protein [Kofleriaceae bacterium]
MKFTEYQREARRTDQLAEDNHSTNALMVPVLGLAGEVGQLVSEVKKCLLTGDDRAVLASVVKEELGDVLWYMSTLADRFELLLDDIAFANLVKVQNRWPTQRGSEELQSTAQYLFDDTFPASEQLPRTVGLRFEEIASENTKRVRITFVDGAQAGAILSDNAYIDDGYRYHDAFHLAYAAILGWSPVLRKLWACKRKSKPAVDEVEDGGRAQVIEEGISALVFSEAKDREYYVQTDRVPSSLVRIIKNMTSHLEVSVRSYREWQDAIVAGYRIFRCLQENHGGYVYLDLRRHKIEYRRVID